MKRIWLLIGATVANDHNEYLEDFKSYDLDKNGLIDPQELRTVYHGTLMEEDLQAFWSAIDTKKQGFFTLEEYIDYALKLDRE